jgi:hypothetical protein
MLAIREECLEEEADPAPAPAFREEFLESEGNPNDIGDLTLPDSVLGVSVIA